MKFGHVEMEKPANPIVWDALSKDEFDFVMKAKNVYEQCLKYSGRDVHEVNGAAGNILNGVDNFLFSFTENGLKPGYMDGLNEKYKDRGSWKAHCRKLTEDGIERALKALNAYVMLNQFENLSCYEEFEIQCALVGISKIDILKEIGHQIDNYYFFVSNDGIFNWFDLSGNHIEDPGILKILKTEYIHYSITKCIIPNNIKIIGNDAFYSCESLTSITIPISVIRIGYYAFSWCTSLKSITIPDNVISIGNEAFYSCKSLKEVIFKGKTLEEIKQMKNYPFGINGENKIKCEI